jgi:hypothetical protein
MANRPRRSGLTQTFAVPNEDDIYDDASIAQLDESGPTEDTDSSGLHDISETLAAFLNDANTPTIDDQSSVPPSPSPVTPATVTGAQFLKRKRDSNASRHLRKHAIFVGRFSATPSTIAQAKSLQQGLHNIALKQAESRHDQTVMVLRSAARKQSFRNALARYVTACSISHKSVVSKEFKALILAINPEAEHVLLRLSSSLLSRIVRNFRAQ